MTKKKVKGLIVMILFLISMLFPISLAEENTGLVTPVLANNPPTQSNPIPANGSIDITIPLDNFTITINDAEGSTMNLTIYTNASGTWLLVNHSNGLTNGTYSNYTNTSWVDTNCTTFYWSVNLTDGEFWTNATYYFTTYCPPLLNITISTPYPTNESTGICPCNDSICISIYNDYGYSMNLTFYVGTTTVNYTNVPNGTYCFCMCGIDVIKYNTTYYWYVNATEYTNSTNYNTSAIFWFNTAASPADCVIAAGGISYAWAASLGILFGGIAIILVLKKRKKRRL